jgi:hypothetical protein
VKKDEPFAKICYLLLRDRQQRYSLLLFFDKVVAR